MKIKQTLVHKVKSSLMNTFLKEGIDDPDQIDVVVVQALKTINSSSLAGHKAAKTKKQTLAYQR